MSWGGYKAVVSLTFDDALSCQREIAVPLLYHFNNTATFFAITNCDAYPLDVLAWRRDVVPYGFEIGAHSVTHRKARDLSFTEMKEETAESKRILENHFDVPVTSFCYPYTDAPGNYQNAVRDAGYTQARGGRVARADKNILRGDDVNLLNVPCYHVNSLEIYSQRVLGFITEACSKGAWIVLMLHGVGDANAWDNVDVSDFISLMTQLNQFKDKGLLVTTFADAAKLYRGEK